MPPPVLPVLLLSKLTRGVNGRPDCAVRMPLSCQCRSSAGALSATGTFHDRRGDQPVPDVEGGRAPLGGEVAAVLRRVVVAVGGEERRRVVLGRRPGVAGLEGQAARERPLDRHLQRVVARRRLRLEEEDVAVAGDRPPIGDVAGAGRGLVQVALADVAVAERPDVAGGQRERGERALQAEARLLRVAGAEPAGDGVDRRRGRNSRYRSGTGRRSRSGPARSGRRAAAASTAG